MRRAKNAVDGLTKGIAFLFKKNKVDWKKGHATFQDAHTVKVGDETVTAKDIVIATGSSRHARCPVSRSTMLAAWSSIPPARWN